MTSSISPAAIDARGLVKSFGAVHAAAGTDLRVQPGEIVAFLGPNGAGKTTTIDIILGLTSPDVGSIQVFGHSPRDAVSRGLVSAVLQTGGLLKDITVAETVELTASFFAERRPVAPEGVSRRENPRPLNLHGPGRPRAAAARSAHRPRHRRLS